MEVDIRVGKLKNAEAAGKDKVTGEMIKGGSNGKVTRFGGCVIWLLRVVLCWKTEDLL